MQTQLSCHNLNFSDIVRIKPPTTAEQSRVCVHKLLETGQTSFRATSDVLGHAADVTIERRPVMLPGQEVTFEEVTIVDKFRILEKKTEKLN